MKLLLLFLFISCAPESNPNEVVSDEYVLIEFASKLEEEYPKLEPIQEK